MFQSILFYIPRWLWKNWEAGKITALMMDLDVGVVSEVEKKQKKKLLLDYLYDNLKNHNWWAYRYFFCELLALLNVIGKELSLLCITEAMDQRQFESSWISGVIKDMNFVYLVPRSIFTSEISDLHYLNTLFKTADKFAQVNILPNKCTGEETFSPKSANFDTFYPIF